MSNFEVIKELIAHRRSIKPVDMEATREVSRELLLELLECANWAPNHGHTEPWRFHVFQGESRQVFADQLQHAYQQETAECDFKPEKHAKMGKNPLLANTVIAVVMKRDPSGKIPEVEEIEAVACAVQNLHLAAAATGLGVFWSSPAVCYGSTIHDFLGLGEKDKCLGFLYIGWPKEEKSWPQSRRSPVVQKVTWR